jgi:ABC-type iron transport system FetAB permease component
MGTIDISYFNLLIGLLLLVIPLFYLWKFKTGLLKATLIGTARMIVQLFLIGMYLKYLFLWNNPWINFLWVIIMIFVERFFHVLIDLLCKLSRLYLVAYKIPRRVYPRRKQCMHCLFVTSCIFKSILQS